MPIETPFLNKIKLLTKSNDQKDLQQLESYCYQFAEKFDDFNEEWIPMDRLLIELQLDIANETNFLKRTKFFEKCVGSYGHLEFRVLKCFDRELARDVGLR